MENLKGKTAIVTGSASGIGLGIAKACGHAGMNVVIADMRQSAIDEVLPFFKEKGWPVHGIQLDVTNREAYAKAADEVEKVFGNIHVLINNAGVEAPMGGVWKNSFKDCDFIVGVNITGVLNGIITVLPRILKHGEGGHVVTTASQSGLTVVPGGSLYNMTKAAVITLMETLATDLADTNVGASAFCPGPVHGNLKNTSKEVRPAHLQNEPAADAAPNGSPLAHLSEEELKDILAKMEEMTMSAEEVGERVIRGIKRGDLYIVTHTEFKKVVKAKMESIMRSYPDQPVNPEFYNAFSFLTNTATYDKQTTPGAPDWEKYW